ncbi:toll/interleukin-1 receptor domain-containing protein [uncultured Kriegella sp.]|uniref:toll/interleukin-1 receptor domain-containing protein n=1 Tax=uncultured Kriegella sp. TaxID=1798910 RepID=UPI0030D74FE5|tara:strand:- start:141047 stop:141934 length:888 start_codon:yes stop_codon:yes gene_type:complete
MIWKKKKQGRIFISYRRSDSQGYAGRLSDSLEAYFGEKRVFRDIEDIKGGSKYAKDIENQLSTADAVIILIGPAWLSVAGENGKRRIDDPEDWVVKEIVTAIENGIRVFPVLIEGTVLPRISELPEYLRPILDYNAITISDRNWDADVLGLGKIISFEIPTANERILFQLQVLIYTALGASLIFSSGWLATNAIAVKKELISLPFAGIPFYVVISTLIILSLIRGLVAKEKKRYINYAIITGVLGSAFFFFGTYFIDEDCCTDEDLCESMFVFFGSILVTTVMYAFLGLSGFKPK